jgi:hypothetical protein
MEQLSRVAAGAPLRTTVRWTVLAAAAGFTGSVIFSSLLQWDRDLFLVPHGLIVGAVTLAYLRTARVTLTTQVRRRWPAGLIVGVAVGALLVRNVLGQPASPGPSGPALGLSIAWLGVVYGVVDALLLTIIPVLSLYGSQPADVMGDPARRVGWALAALAGSLAVTAAYHLGFAEFRGPTLVAPLIGNAMITVAYLISGNPLAPIVAHVLMHGAAVLHGFATAAQLPPHY